MLFKKKKLFHNFQHINKLLIGYLLNCWIINRIYLIDNSIVNIMIWYLKIFNIGEELLENWILKMKPQDIDKKLIYFMCHHIFF